MNESKTEVTTPGVDTNEIKKRLGVIEEKIGIGKGVITSAVFSDQEIQLPDGKFFSPIELKEKQDFSFNLGFGKGHGKGHEEFSMELLKKLGVGEQPESYTVDGVLKYVTNVNKSNKQDKNDLEYQKEIDNIKKEYEEKIKSLNDNNSNILLRYELSSHIPDKLPAGWTKERVINTYLSEVSEKKNENGENVIYKSGKPTYVNDGSNVTYADHKHVLNEWLSENNMIVTEKAGRGDSDNIKSTGLLEMIKDKESFLTYLKTNNIKYPSIEASNILKQRPKDIQDIILKID